MEIEPQGCWLFLLGSLYPAALQRRGYSVTVLGVTVWPQFTLPASCPGPPFPTHLASTALTLKLDVTHWMVALITKRSLLTGDSPYVYTVEKFQRRQFGSSPYTDPPVKILGLSVPDFQGRASPSSSLLFGKWGYLREFTWVHPNTGFPRPQSWWKPDFHQQCQTSLLMFKLVIIKWYSVLSQ